jgi:holo-[acyl-carrier protein] synthase
MSSAGLGVEIIEIERVKRALDRSPRFKSRVFSEGECAYCDTRARPEVYYAMRFAAKGAVLKALDTHFGDGILITDVEVTEDRYGRPEALLRGGASECAQAQGIVELHLSLTFTHEVGVANAVAIRADARPRPDTVKDLQAELAAAFKAARSMLDEMDGKKKSSSQSSGTEADDQPTLYEQDTDGEPDSQPMTDGEGSDREALSRPRDATGTSAAEDIVADADVSEREEA